jgi:hypothetical protein
MDLLRVFAAQHAATHAADVYDGLTAGADRWPGDLSDAQLRVIPGPGLNSIVWLLWHMARTEDAAVNLVVAGRPQAATSGSRGSATGRGRATRGATSWVAPRCATTRATSARPSPSAAWPASAWEFDGRPHGPRVTLRSRQSTGGDAAWPRGFASP